MSPFIAVVATIIAILAIVIACVRCSGLRRKLDDLKERIEKCKAEAKQMESNFKREIEAKTNQLKSLNTQINQVRNAVEELKTSTEALNTMGDTDSQHLRGKTTDAEHTIYASSYDSIRNQFFTIEPSPSQKTVYEITYFESNPQTGYFTIYKGAENKVVECRDHLDSASEIEGRGNRIDWDSLNPGKLTRKADNWEVVTPLTVKFV